VLIRTQRNSWTGSVVNSNGTLAERVSDSAVTFESSRLAWLDSIDFLRGLVMSLMAFDHVRDFFLDRLFLGAKCLRFAGAGGALMYIKLRPHRVTDEHRWGLWRQQRKECWTVSRGSRPARRRPNAWRHEFTL
jgi:hypothetical protein